MSLRCHARGLLPAILALLFATTVAAQPRGREAVLLTTDAGAIRRLETARQQLKAGQWEEAVPLLRQAADQFGETWVPVEKGRYLPVQVCCDMLLATLPPEALAQYRRRIDPQARRWFDQAASERDEELLARIVRQALVSSQGDDALWLLGELAFERGLPGRARGYWSRLVPHAAPVAGEDWPDSAAYPDSTLDPALVRARLMLCSVMEGDFARAQKELEEFAERHSEARGTLAGRTGPLAQILADVLDEVRRTEQPAVNSETSTFAGSSDRNRVLPKTYDLGGRLWSVDLRAYPPPADEVFPRDNTAPKPVPTYYPAVVGNIVVVCDEYSVYALDLHKGTPAFPAEQETFDADDVGLTPDLVKTRIYKLPPEMRPVAGAAVDALGIPAFAPTVDHGRVYARLGTVTRRHDIDSRRAPRGYLVCLDLSREGAHVATLDSESITFEGGGWTFEGAPVVAGDRVCIGLRKHKPQPQVAVACYDAALQRLLWAKVVGLGANSHGGDGVEISHQMLSLSGERLFYNTNLGAIAALDVRDGAPLWIATYEHVDLTVDELNARGRRGPNPCVIQGDTVYASPYDSHLVLAFDAETGKVKWQQSFRGEFGNVSRRRKPISLLGVVGDRLVAAGDALWTLDAATGQPRVIGHDDPDVQHQVHGRGLLAAGLVYTTSVDTLFVREAATGRADRLPNPAPAAVNPLAQHGCPQGGNLVQAKGVLLVAQSGRLTALADVATLRKKKTDEVAKIADPSGLLELALLESLPRLTENSRKHFREARGLAGPADRWEGLPLVGAAARAEFQGLMDSGRRLRQAMKPAEAAAEFLEAGQLGRKPLDRLHALQNAAAAWLEAGKTAKALEAWQQVLEDPVLRETATTIGPTAGTLARLQILGMIRKNGRAVYASVEQRAHRLFQDAAGDPLALRALIEQFPHSSDAETVRLEIGELLADRGLTAQALTTFRQALAEVTEPEALARAAMLSARTAEQLQHWETARKLWEGLAERHPKTVVVAGPVEKTAREWVPPHLAAAEFRAVSRDPAPHLSRAWSTRDALPGSLIVPEGTHRSRAAGGLLFSGSRLQAVSLGDGRRHWDRPLDNPVLWAALEADWLIAGSSSSIAALDPLGGAVAWEASAGGSPFESFRADGPAVVCRKRDGTLEAFAALDGRRLWSYRPAGELLPCWTATGGRVVLQSRFPPETILLGSREGGVISLQAGSGLWLDDPVPVGQDGIALVTGPQDVQVIDRLAGTLRWVDHAPGRPTYAPHAVLAAGDDLLLVRDGTTGTRMQARTGQPMWPAGVRLGAEPLTDLRRQTCVDGQRLYVASAGIMRAFWLTNGKLAWEQVLGERSAGWRTARIGKCLAAWPSRAHASAAVLVCDPNSGTLVQRVPLPRAGKLTIEAAGDALVVAAAGGVQVLSTVTE